MISSPHGHVSRSSPDWRAGSALISNSFPVSSRARPLITEFCSSAGDCVGPCGLAVHGYGIDSEATGVWFDHNAGVRLTAFRIGQILDIAGQND